MLKRVLESALQKVPRRVLGRSVLRREFKGQQNRGNRTESL